MNTRTPFSAIFLTSAIALGISAPASADHGHQVKRLNDKQAPTVIYNPAASADDKKQFTVTVKDNAGIQSVTLFYRKPGNASFMSTRMKRVGESSSYISDLGKRGLNKSMDFNILAVDLAGNSQLVSGNSSTPVNAGQTTAALSSNK